MTTTLEEPETTHVEDDLEAPLIPLAKLRKDLQKAAETLSPHEARYLVSVYYQLQDLRIILNNQEKSNIKRERPHAAVSFFLKQLKAVERQVAQVLDTYSESKELGRWVRQIVGIGPIISAGLLAHIDLNTMPHVSNLWSFAGLNPTMKWEKGQKRPYNENLKVLCAGKIGQSFVYNQNRPNDIYGKVYAKRKELEVQRNEAGNNAEKAAEILQKKRFDKKTVAYQNYIAGKFPPAHIHARARRYAVKLFLSHYWATGRAMAGLPVTEPYAIAVLGHSPESKINPPYPPKPATS